MERQAVVLKRSINWAQGVALTIGAVLGSGVLVLPVLAAQLAGPASLVSWALMGLLAIPLVATIGNLASHWPEAGGIAAYARRAFGHRAGTATGWLFLGTIPIGGPIMALVGASYLGAYLSFTPLDILFTAALMLALAILFNYLGINLSGRVQMVVVGIIALILLVIILSALPNVSGQAFIPFAPHGWIPVGVAMTVLFWAFVGWEMVVHLAEEFQDPGRDIKLSLGISLIVINLLYLLLAFVIVGTRSYLEGNKIAVLATMIFRIWGRPAGAVVAALGFIVCYGSLHTYVAGFSRLVYAQARQGDFPSFFSRLHTVYQTPHRVLLSLAPVFALVLCLDFFCHLDLTVLIQFTSAIFIALYIVCMAAAVRLLRGFGRGRLYAVISLVVCLGVYLFTGWAGLYPVLLGTVGWIVGTRQQA
ncbi:MAG: amino acid permease [Thermacetogeniaceae bacterium]|jgi:amino acid efflux transporter